MVIVSTGNHMKMKIHLSSVGDRIKELTHHFGVHLANLRNGESDVRREVRPAAEIHRAEDECLVHGQSEAAVAADACFVTDRLTDCGAQHNTNVLNRVVRVYIEVAFAGAGEVEEPVAGEAVQHVIEEADSCVDAGSARPVKVQCDGDVGLFGGTGDSGGAEGGFILGHSKNSLNNLLTALYHRFLPCARAAVGIKGLFHPEQEVCEFKEMTQMNML